MLNLHLNARPYERFFLSYEVPHLVLFCKWWRFRYLKWAPLPWRSFSIRFRHIDDKHFWGFQVYVGKLFGDHYGGKVDWTRTMMLRSGQLGGSSMECQFGYVYVATPSEQWAIRTRTLDYEPVVSNMGGA